MYHAEGTLVVEQNYCRQLNLTFTISSHNQIPLEKRKLFTKNASGKYVFLPWVAEGEKCRKQKSSKSCKLFCKQWMIMRTCDTETSFLWRSLLLSWDEGTHAIKLFHEINFHYKNSSAETFLCHQIFMQIFVCF